MTGRLHGQHACKRGVGTFSLTLPFVAVRLEIFPVLRQTIKPTLPAETLLPVLQKGGRTSRSHNHSRQTSTTTQGGARVPLDNRTHWPGQVALEPPLPNFRGLWRVGKSKMGCGRTTVRHHTSPTTTWNKSHKATLHFCPHDTLALRARLLQHDTQRQRRTTQHSTRRVVSTLRSHLDARTRAPRHLSHLSHLPFPLLLSHSGLGQTQLGPVERAWNTQEIARA